MSSDAPLPLSRLPNALPLIRWPPRRTVRLRWRLQLRPAWLLPSDLQQRQLLLLSLLSLLSAQRSLAPLWRRRTLPRYEPMPQQQRNGLHQVLSQRHSATQQTPS